jgi:hypothetical protein
MTKEQEAIINAFIKSISNHEERQFVDNALLSVKGFEGLPGKVCVLPMITFCNEVNKMVEDLKDAGKDISG